MPALKIDIGETQHLVDLDGLMLSELEILEEHAGVNAEDLNDLASLRKFRFIGHILWLIKLREAAAAEGIALREAALKHPRDQFDISTGSLRMELVGAPKSSAGPRTPTTRMPRTGSSKPRARSAKTASAKSAASPRSSASGPGSSSG
jgi:hypothetical protein